jgi:hypothetical protein
MREENLLSSCITVGVALVLLPYSSRTVGCLDSGIVECLNTGSSSSILCSDSAAKSLTVTLPESGVESVLSETAERPTTVARVSDSSAV